MTSIATRIDKLEECVGNLPSAPAAHAWNLTLLTADELREVRPIIAKVESKPRLPDGRPDYSALSDDEVILLAAAEAKATSGAKP